MPEPITDPKVEPTDTPDSSAPDSTEPDPAADEPDPEGDMFARSYVERLRRESATYRDRAGRADKLAERLHTALVAATGRLADPSDLAFDAAHLDDPDALAAAVDALLTRKPHLAVRRPRGDVGQGQTGGVDTINLADLLRARA